MCAPLHEGQGFSQRVHVLPAHKCFREEPGHMSISGIQTSKPGRKVEGGEMEGKGGGRCSERRETGASLSPNPFCFLSSAAASCLGQCCVGTPSGWKTSLA